MTTRRLVSITLAIVFAACLGGCTAGAPASTAVRIPRVLIFGDSYTEGWGSETPSAGYAYLVGDPLNWDVRVDGVGSTGYVNPGNKQQGTYLSRLSQEKPATFDIVVLQGSSNDRLVPISTLQTAVAEMVTAVRAKYPAAQLVMMGPCALNGPASADLLGVNGLLSTYAQQNEIPFIDPIGDSWFGPGETARMKYANPKNGHPNDRGYAHIAEMFIRDVKALPSIQSGG